MATKDEGALRKQVEETADKVNELREKYAENQDQRTGRALLKAREKAREALVALWDAVPEEKPPPQAVM
jgi:hypothetical protein